MDFKKYNSIENAYQEKFIDKIKQLFIQKRYIRLSDNWFVTEKIHGCNVQITYDGNEIRYGSRNDFLQDGDKFYNYKEVLGKYDTNVVGIFEYLKNICNIEEITLFGELFGGHYPHKDVQRAKNASKVQKGVYYTPDNNVNFFDIRYLYYGKYYYINGLTFLELCKEYDLPHVPVLATNLSLDEALKFKNDGLSEVYKMYNLPPIENNIMEGIVIRGYEQEYVLPNGTRAIIKSKNDKFKEVSHEKKQDLYKELPEHIKNILNKVIKYNTPQRVENVISHFGELNNSMIGDVLKELNQDIINDFCKDNNDFNTLEKKEIKYITKLLSSNVSKLAVPIIVNNINERMV